VGQVYSLHISQNVPIDAFITVGNVKEKIFFMVLLKYRKRDKEFRNASFLLSNSTDVKKQVQKVEQAK